MMPWHKRPPRSDVAREAVLAMEPVLAQHLSEEDLNRVLFAVEALVERSLSVVSGRGGRRDPATGIVRPANLQYTHPARTAQEAIRDEALVAQGRHIPSPRQSLEQHGEDRVGTVDPAAQQPRRKLYVPPSWA